MMHEREQGDGSREAGAEAEDALLQEAEPRNRPRIYVASLSDYNAGRLHGTWIDTNQTVEEVGGEITAMLALSPEPGAKEWAIHDHEGFGPYHVGEYESLQ